MVSTEWSLGIIAPVGFFKECPGQLELSQIQVEGDQLGTSLLEMGEKYHNSSSGVKNTTKAVSEDIGITQQILPNA